MENNKFNRFYSKKLVAELLEQLLSHRITDSTLDKEWYEALKIHLSERELNEGSRKIFEKILHTDPKILKQEEYQIVIEINGQREAEINSSNIGLKKSSINKAGQSLKNIVYTAITLIVCTVIGIYISVSSNDLNTSKNAYLLIGVASLICNILILHNLYKAGDHLENS